MANADTPHGLTFARTVHGGPPRIEWFTGTSDNAFYKGGFLATSTSFAVPIADPTSMITDGAQIVGIIAAYVPDATTTVQVPAYTDLQNTVFTIQANNTTNFTAAATNVNLRWSTTSPALGSDGSTVTGLSYLELDAGDYASGSAAGVGYRLIPVDGGLVDIPNNVGDGGNQEVDVMVLDADTRFGTTVADT